MRLKNCRTLRGCVDWNVCVRMNLRVGNVAPYVGAWIETSSVKEPKVSSSRTLRGCVDWNLTNEQPISIAKVAPYVGAWIETRVYIAYVGSQLTSHPTWVRGLKRLSDGDDNLCFCCRTLRGCVDWNYISVVNLEILAMSHPTWVRGLKLLHRRYYLAI